MIKEVILGLDFDSAYRLARELPEMSEVEIAAVLAALESRGYGADVIAGFVKGVVDGVSVDLGKVADTCGTGGDRAGTINVSTAVAIALSTLHPVAKHGNRSVSSKSGSADVLEALGVDIEMNPEKAKRMVEETNFAFLFAPLYHSQFAKVAGVRKELKIRTIFNIAGPLSNPANPVAQLVGVADEGLVGVVAEALDVMGKRGVVVHGSGIDEVHPGRESVIAIVSKGVDVITLTPADFGVESTKLLQCHNSAESAGRIRAVFSGRGCKEDTNLIAVNFATAMYAVGYEDLKENVEIFFEKIESGEFMRKLEEIVCKSTSTLNR